MPAAKCPGWLMKIDKIRPVTVATVENQVSGSFKKI